MVAASGSSLAYREPTAAIFGARRAPARCKNRLLTRWIVVVSYFQAALAGLHGKQIRASGFGRGSNKQGGGVKETRGGQRNKGGSNK